MGKEEQDPVPLIFGNPVLVERDAEARPRTDNDEAYFQLDTKF